MDELNPYQTPASVQSSFQPSGMVDPERLKTTRVGLYMVYYGIVALLLGGILMPILFGVAAATGVQALAVVGAIGLMLAMFGGALAMFVGQICCLTVPEDSGARTMIIITVVIQAVGFLVSMGAGVFVAIEAANGNVQQPGEVGPVNAVQMIGGILGMASFLTFVNFLRKLNLYIQQEDLADKASSIFRWIIGLFIAYFVMIVAVIAFGVVGQNGGAFAGIAGIAMCGGLGILLAGLVVFIRYANLLVYTAKAIGGMTRYGM